MYNDEVFIGAMRALDALQTPNAVPPLPPSGCYGAIHVSSAISEGLGAAAAEAEAAAGQLGEQPVKVLLPWYPANAGGHMDCTKPAKVATSTAKAPALSLRANAC